MLVAYNTSTLGLTCQDVGVLGSVLELVVPVSVHCDCVGLQLDMQLLTQCGCIHNLSEQILMMMMMMMVIIIIMMMMM